MSCERFDKLIYLFLDGRLDQEKEKALKEHLSECERCAKKLALLESVEGRAKKIKIKAPPQEYWDSFSSRVREKIDAREERSPVFGLKKVFESIFTFSPLKIKVAAGLVSVVLVFIIGKLYVDYRGQEILPSKAVIQTEKQPPLDIMEMEKKEGFPIEKGRKRVKSAVDKLERETKPTDVREAKEKAIPSEKLVDEEEGLLKEKKFPASPKVVEEKAAPAHAPALEPQAPVEIETPSEQQPISLEPKPTGAGVEEGIGEKVVKKMAAPKEKAQKAKKVLQKGEAERAVSKDIIAPIRPTPQVSLAMDHYEVNKTTIPKIEEHDTLMQMDELRRTIRVWIDYINENPTDSLSKEGYLQIATAYYLLAKLSQDTTVISEGSKLIEEYLDQIKDPTVKDNLSDKLKNIKALRQR